MATTLAPEPRTKTNISRRKCANLQLRTRALQELSATAGNAKLTRIHNGDLENDLATLLPQLGLQRLARQHGAGEADFDVLDGAVISLVSMLIQ